MVVIDELIWCFLWLNQLQVSVEDVKSVLGQRGPDSVGEKTIHLQQNVSTCGQDSVTLSVFEASGGTYDLEETTSLGELHFIGSTLQLRGTSPIRQPLVDSSGNILAYNGVVLFLRFLIIICFLLHYTKLICIFSLQAKYLVELNSTAMIMILKCF